MQKLHGLPLALRVLVMERPRRLHHRAPRRPTQLLHPEDPARHRPRPADRRQPDVRGARGVPLQAGPVLLEQLHAHGEAAGGPDFDGGLATLGRN